MENKSNVVIRGHLIKKLTQNDLKYVKVPKVDVERQLCSQLHTNGPDCPFEAQIQPIDLLGEQIIGQINH